MAIKLLDQNDFGNNDLFSNLQGNILKGHGRDFTTNIFVKFDKRREKRVSEWIATFATDKVTSCKKQLKENELFKRNKVSGDVFYGFLITALGYQYLGKETTAFENSFKNGLKNAALNDPSVSKWDEGFREEIHAMILIADLDNEKLGNISREIIKELNSFAKIVTIEYGNAIRNENKDGIEHFGYVDGVSQPLFFEYELDKYIKQNGGKDKFDPSADKNLVLVNDPLIDTQEEQFKDIKDAFGSYFVFRKLEQNVRKFKKDEQKLADELKLDKEDRERAGAMIVGRFEDGTPVQISDEDGIIGSGAFNNFDYNNDDNSKCPFHAHIRKSNPRRNEGDKNHIMARRGIPYGYRNTPTNVEQDFLQMPEDGVGLLFMSFQSSIANQFEFIQNNWVNNPTFPSFDTIHPDGIDPIIGQDGNKNSSKGMFPKEWGDTSPDNLKPGTFESAVTMKGGEYFFAPSIPFLKSL